MISNNVDAENIVNNVDREPKLDAKGRSYGTGRRKESVARVWLKPGTGKININGKDLAEYTTRHFHAHQILMPFIITSTSGCYDVMATVKGGGLSGQAGAIALGISRALNNIAPHLHSILRKNGALTRDSRVVERKKYGQHKARKKVQYSKR